MKIKFYWFFTILTALFLNSQNVYASCDVGPVLFRDTLYGTGVGAGLGALVLIANSSTTNIAPTVATAALVGAGAGLIVGALEISVSGCMSGSGKKGRDDSYSFGFNMKPMINVVDSNLGGGFTFEFPMK